jgi:exonuclease VII large subunit
LSSIAALTNNAKEALEMQLKSLAIREQVFAETQTPDSHIAAAYTETGKAMIMNGMFNEAREMIQKSVDSRKQMANFSRLQLYTPLLYTSIIHLCEDNHQGAAEALLEAARDREVEYGVDDQQSPRYVKP